jgi:MFS family permease
MARTTRHPAPEVGSTNLEAPPASMRRIATAAFVGSTIEFYDFFIYGIAAALVFAPTFFPALGPAAGTVAAFATLGVAFVARPFGAVLFGHFGDRLGRKKTLVATLMLMGVATVLVGAMPTTEQIGVAAPILIVVLRILQGLAAGGEWAGAALFTSENAPKARRGFWSMFASLGGGAALVLGNGTFLVVGLLMSDESFASWGWRIPFLASFVLVFVGLWIRLRIDESPVFKREVQTEGASRVPFGEAFRRQPREVLLAMGAVIMVPTFTYIGGSYLTNYGTTVLELGRNVVLAVGLIGGLTISLGTIVGAVWSDRVGRRRVILTAACVALVWAVSLFPLLDLRTTATFGIGAAVTMFISGVAYGPMAAYLSELFETRYRYSASGFSYSFAQIIGGAIPPLIAAAVISAAGSFVFGLVLASFVLVSLLCVLALRETQGNDMARTSNSPADHRAGNPVEEGAYR